MSRYIYLLIVILYSNIIVAQQRVIPKDDQILKSISLKYFELAIAQDLIKKKEPCDRIMEADIINSEMHGMEVASRISDKVTKKGVINYIKSHMVINSFCTKIALSNLENDQDIGSLEDIDNVKKALNGFTFWGPVRGMYGNCSYYDFDKTTVKYYYKKEPDSPNWSFSYFSYQLYKQKNGSLVLKIGDKNYEILNNPFTPILFSLIPLENKDDFDDTFYELMSTCES
jgi:hypothetical protein